MKLKKKKVRSLEAMQQRNGWLFVLPWVVGLCVFMLLPLASSFAYSFSDVKIEVGRIVINFVGLEHFKTIIFKDAELLDILLGTLAGMLSRIPFLIATSLVISVILNKNFIGRSFFRCLYFLPIIIMSSAILNILGSEFILMPTPVASSTESELVDFSEIIRNLNIPEQFSGIITNLVNGASDIIWACGVQTILFLAGLQAIPETLYEASKVEGANIWEDFWFITIPSLRHIISLVFIFTMIDSFANSWPVSIALNKMMNADYGPSSALVWLFFAVAGSVTALILLAYNKIIVKRWE